MLKFQCGSCKQAVAVVVQSSREPVKCPRCGAMNDLNKPQGPEEANEVSDEDMVTQMLDTQAQAKVRKQAQQALAVDQRDDQQRHELEHRHAVTQRINKLGKTAQERKSHSKVISTIILLLFALLGWAGVSYMLNGGGAGGFGGSGDSGDSGGVDSQVLNPLVDQWVRSLSSNLRYQGVKYHVYNVAIDNTASEGDLLVINGTVSAADRQISKAQAAGRIAREQPEDEQLPESTEDRKRKLKEGIKTFRNTYDPKRMDQITSMKSPGAPGSPAGSGSTDAASSTQQQQRSNIRDLGFETESDSQAGGSGSSTAQSQKQGIHRPFVLVIRKDDSTASFPSGLALEYFVWESQVKSGSTQLLKGGDQAPIEKVVNAIFTSRKEGTDDYSQYLKVYGHSYIDDLFPNRFKPDQWTLVRCDIIKNRSVRAFVQVVDANTKNTGTWILTMLQLEGDGQWRVARTWRTKD